METLDAALPLFGHLRITGWPRALWSNCGQSAQTYRSIYIAPII